MTGMSAAEAIFLEAMRAAGGVDGDREDRIESEVERLRIRAEATRRYATELDPNRDRPLDAGLLSEVLARPDDEQWRIERMLPAGGRMLIVGAAKVGKTTMLGNLCRALLSAETFLGRFAVGPVDGRVGFLNFEVTARQCALWLGEMGVPGDRLLLVTLRGAANPLNDADGRRDLAARLRAADVRVLVVDPFARGFGGESQNDAGEVQRWLMQLDSFAEEAGCEEVILTAHAGWDGERTRGSSALVDWPDSIVTLTRDETGAHYFRAYGRDVEIDEDRLDFDAATRRLALSGAGNRVQAKAAAGQAVLAEILTDEPDLSQSKIVERLKDHGVGRNAAVEMIRSGVAAGWILTSPGPQRSTQHRLNPASAPASQSAPGHWGGSSAPPPYRGALPLTTGKAILPTRSGTLESANCPRCGEPADQLAPDRAGVQVCPPCLSREATP